MNSGSTYALRPVAVKGLKTKNKLRRTVMLATATTLLSFNWGCSGEEYNDLPGPTPTGDEVPVMVMMNVPAAAATRALISAQEDAVNTLDVIVFLDPQDGTDQTYLYTTHGSEYLAEGNVTAVKVNFQKSKQGEAHRFVMVANMAAEIYTLKDSWTVGMSKKDLLSTLTFDAYDLAEADEDKRVWDTTTPRYLPMWGESAASHVVTSSLQGYSIGTIKMLRAVATVDIVLNPDGSYAPQGFGNLFHLHDIKVYNVPQKGFGGPDPDNLETAVKVDKPTVSTSFHRDAATVVAYEADQSLGEHIYGTSKTIYIPEADNTAAGVNLDDSKQTCLVISGRYNGETDLTWYRMDFIKVLEQQKNLRWDILRNHRYTFYITSVDGPGYPDEETAFNSAPLNLDSEIIVWNDEGKMNDITFDGNYHLSVDVDSLYFYNEGRARAINITTDHPDGWEVVIPSPDMDWVTTLWPNLNSDGNACGAKNSTDEVEFECDKITNPLEVDREGYIIIKAGKLRKYIKIYQGNVEELTIEVTPNLIYFRKSGSNPKSITVKVYPESSLVHFSETPGDNPISWVTGPSYYTPPAANLGVYPIQPGVNTSDPKAILSSMITVYIVGSDGIPVGKNVTVMQYADDLVFSPTPANPYPAIGAKHTFQVESDSDWQVYNTTDPDGMIPQPDMDLKLAGTVNYTIDLQDNNTWYGKTAELLVKSNHPDFAGQPIIITQNAPGVSLELSSPTVDITGGSGTVRVNSNAFFDFAKGTGYGDVVSTESISVGTNGNENPIQAQETPVTFTRRIYSAAGGTPSAGNIAGTATFTSTGHPGASVTRNLTINQTVPAFFNLKSGNTSIGRTGGNVAVNVETNAAWYANPSVMGSGTGNQSPGAWGTRSVNVNIPANVTWTSPYNTPVNRTVTVNTYYGLNTSSMTTFGGSFTVAQPGYYYSAASVVATSTPTAATGGSATIRLTGDFPNTAVASRVSGQTSNLATATITASNTNNQVAVSIPAHTLWTTRDVVVGYIPNYNTSGFIQLGSYRQVARYSTSGASTTMPTSFTGAQTYTVTVTGTYPASSVQYQITGGQNGTIGPHTLTASTSSSSASFTVPANTAERTINVQYKTPTMSAFQTIRSATQTRPASLSYSTSWSSAGYKQTATLYLSGYWSSPIRVTGVWGGYSVYVDVPAGTSATVEMSAQDRVAGGGSVSFSFANPANNNNTVTIPKVNGNSTIRQAAPSINVK